VSRPISYPVPSGGVTHSGLEGRVAALGRTRTNNGDREEFPPKIRGCVAAVGGVRINYGDEGKG